MRRPDSDYSTTAPTELEDAPTVTVIVAFPGGMFSGTRNVTRVEPIVPGSGAIEITAAGTSFTLT